MIERSFCPDTLEEINELIDLFSNMEHGDIYDKQGNPIHQEDYVFTRIRGGTHEGKVRQISTDLSINQESKFLGVFFNLQYIASGSRSKRLFQMKIEPRKSL